MRLIKPAWVQHASMFNSAPGLRGDTGTVRWTQADSFRRKEQQMSHIQSIRTSRRDTSSNRRSRYVDVQNTRDVELSLRSQSQDMVDTANTRRDRRLLDESEVAVHNDYT
jgi:hypothetical protein